MPQGGPVAHAGAPRGDAAAAAAVSQAQPALVAEAAERPVVAARDADALAAWHAVERALRRRGALTVSVDPPDAYDFENQLYRVEVHTAGAGGPHLKWARDNASVAWEVTGIELIPPAAPGANAAAPAPLGAKPVQPELWVSVKDLGYDRAAIEVGAIVEVAGRVEALSGQTWPLLKVVEVEWNARRIKAQVIDVFDWSGPTGGAETGELLLRRWNGAGTPSKRC